MSFTSLQKVGQEITQEHLAPLFPPLPIFSGSFGFRDFVTVAVNIAAVLGIS